MGLYTRLAAGRELLIWAGQSEVLVIDRLLVAAASMLLGERLTHLGPNNARTTTLWECIFDEVFSEREHLGMFMSPQSETLKQQCLGLRFAKLTGIAS